MDRIVSVWSDHLLPETLKEIAAYCWQAYPLRWPGDLNIVPVVNRPAHEKSHGLAQLSRYRVVLMLSKVYGWGTDSEFSMWHNLLRLMLHEIGHFFTWTYLPKGEYSRKRRGWRRLEHDAEQWADGEISRLTSLDKRLFQPPNLGAYLTARRAARSEMVKRHETKGPPDWRLLNDYRKSVSGGQLTTGEVAHRIRAYRREGRKEYFNSPQLRRIRNIAGDLAYHYTDGAGRDHMHFAFGDVGEIARRYYTKYPVTQPWASGVIP